MWGLLACAEANVLRNLTIPAAAKELRLSLPTVGKSLDHLVALGIVREITGKQRRRVFAYRKYLAILDRGTEPLPR